MSQIEEFQNYYTQKKKEEESQDYEEEEYEEEEKERSEENIISDEDKNISKKIKSKISTSKRLRKLPKKYKTYSIDKKKQIIEEVSHIY